MPGLANTPVRMKRFIPHADRAVPVLKQERFDQLAHDARNVLAALQLYCEFLAEPGVLSTENAHCAREMQAIVDTTAHLVERLANSRRIPLASRSSEGNSSPAIPAPPPFAESWTTGSAESDSPGDLGRELLHMQPLLSAIAGPSIELDVDASPCAGRTGLSGEDFTRILMNLVRNAAEAMPGGGKLRVTAQYGEGLSFMEPDRMADLAPRTVSITVQDNGPGIPEKLRESIFEAGFTTRPSNGKWPAGQHRGLGLSIVRGLVEVAGGTVQLAAAGRPGARFEIDLPITYGTYQTPYSCTLVTDAGVKGCIECQ